MKPFVPDPERWSDRGGADDTVEDLVGAALRRVRDATTAADVEAARVGVSPRQLRGRGAGRRVRVLAFALVALLAAGGTVSATRGTVRAWAVRLGLLSAPAPASIAPDDETRSARRTARGERIARPAPSDGVEPALAPRAVDTPLASPAPAPRTVDAPAASPATVPRAAPVPAVAARAVAPRAPLGSAVATPPAEPAAAAPALSDPSGEEAELVARAFRALRTAHDPAAALAALDERERLYPAGRLRAEARLARAEAFVALGRAPEALTLLQGLGAALPRESRLARAELLADSDRCSSAVLDFGAVLASTDADALGERALHGRASCRLTAGEAGAARADLERMLAVHPAGRFAADGRRALDRLAPSRGAPSP